MACPVLLSFEADTALSHPLSQFSFIIPRRLAGQRLSSIFRDEKTLNPKEGK